MARAIASLNRQSPSLSPAEAATTAALIGGEKHGQHPRRLSLRRDPLSDRGRADRSRAVSLHGLPASRRRTDGRLVDVCRGRAQGDEGDAKNLSVLRTWPPAVLRRLRHGPVLHQCECASWHRRYPERDLRRSRRRAGDGAYPDGRTDSLDGARPRTAELRALSTADIAAARIRKAD